MLTQKIKKFNFLILWKERNKNTQPLDVSFLSFKKPMIGEFYVNTIDQMSVSLVLI